MAWTRKTAHYNVIDRKKPGSGFMVAELRYIRDKKLFSTLSVPLEIQQADQCGEFYYYVYGNQPQCDDARFLVILECQGQDAVEILRTTTGQRRWTRVRANINKTPGSKCTIKWRVSRGLSNTHSYVAIDDVKMSMGKCKSKDEPEKTESLDCSFDSVNSCGWKISGAVPPSFSGWGTRQSSTGPTSYFGYKTYPSGTRGHYLYLDSRSSSYIGKSLFLQSPVVKSDVPKCMRMALSMYGKNMGSVLGYVVSNGEEKEVFRREGNHNGNSYKWLDTGITLPANSTFQIKLKATIGNGTKSDIAIDNILVTDGECVENKELSHCQFDQNPACMVTEDLCPGNLTKEHEIKEEFKPVRGRKETIIEKVAKEWTVSVDIKLLGKPRSWTNLFHFTDNGNCCNKGDRTPAVFVYGGSTRLLINSQHHSWNGAILELNKWTNLKMEQKKENQYYYFNVYINGVRKYRRVTHQISEYNNVKVFTSDPWYLAGNATMKNFKFTNGDFAECNPVCNNRVGTPAFVQQPPEKLMFNAEQSPVRGKLLTTLSSLQKEWRVALDVKITGIVRSWSNILHATIRSNCCNRGDRIPAIFVFGGQTRLHITNQVGWSGNHAYNSLILKKDLYSRIVLQQVKDDKGVYKYAIISNNKTIYTTTQSKPTVYKNVKYYLSDGWYGAPQVKVKNIVIENLVASYPCSGMCKGKKGTEKVNGKEVNTITYDSETCAEKGFISQLAMPQLLRYGCFEMSFRTYGSYCPVYLRDDYRQLRHYRPKSGQWTHVKQTLFQSSNKIGITSSINYRCTKVTVTEMKLTEGMC